MRVLDVIWLILDSLSFEATPFAKDGPDTMPKLENLAKEKGFIYTKAYSPGPASPSSHSSFFTGELPSQTGMHEAHPFFNKDIRTIAGVLNETHISLAISTNPFIFNRLCRDFHFTVDLVGNQSMLFPKARDPRDYFSHRQFDSKIRKYFKFIFDSKKPFRSMINGLSYLIWYKTQSAAIPKISARDKRSYQYANTMNQSILNFTEKASSNVFIVPNYMDVHAPLDASDDALQRFLPGRDRKELPIGVNGQEIHSKVKEGDKEMEEISYKLYKAAIWDLDKKITPLIKFFIERNAFIVVTADHGNWFRRKRDLEDRRIHIPLLIFTPPYNSKVINKTVNLRSLPRTTMEEVRGENGNFEGTNLLETSSHQLSITEYIHNPEKEKRPVSPYGSKNLKNQYDIVAIKGKARLELIRDQYLYSEGSPEEIKELKTKIEKLRKSRFPSDSSEEVTYEKEIKQRLKDLGYL